MESTSDDSIAPRDRHPKNLSSEKVSKTSCDKMNRKPKASSNPSTPFKSKSSNCIVVEDGQEDVQVSLDTGGLNRAVSYSPSQRKRSTRPPSRGKPRQLLIAFNEVDGRMPSSISSKLECKDVNVKSNQKSYNALNVNEKIPPRGIEALLQGAIKTSTSIISAVERMDKEETSLKSSNLPIEEIESTDTDCKLRDASDLDSRYPHRHRAISGSFTESDPCFDSDTERDSNSDSDSDSDSDNIEKGRKSRDRSSDMMNVLSPNQERKSEIERLRNFTEDGDDSEVSEDSRHCPNWSSDDATDDEEAETFSEGADLLVARIKNRLCANDYDVFLEVLKRYGTQTLSIAQVVAVVTHLLKANGQDSEIEGIIADFSLLLT